MKKTLALAALGIAVPSAVQAITIIDTYPDFQGNYTSGYIAQAQEFVAPNDDNVLLSWQFSLEVRVGQGDVTFGVYNFSAAGPTGSALYTSTFPWGASGNKLVDDINLALAPGGRYFAVVDFHGYNQSSIAFNANQNSYNAGNGWWNNGVSGWQDLNGLNQTFKATFVPEPATMTAFGLGALALLRRRKLRSASE